MVREVNIRLELDVDAEQLGTAVSEVGVRIAMGATAGPVILGGIDVGAFAVDHDQ